ncbi:unnamed protein product, partial [Laminaria digitata]
WHPLRVGGSAAGAKACEMRLGVHFLSDFPCAPGPLPGQLSGQLPGQGGADDANFVTIVLEEGRNLSHPDMPVGPLELFAEACVHYHPRGGERRYHAVGEPTRNVSGRASQRSERMVGPLPILEAPSNAAANGVGSSPCWRHLLRVPLPPALLCDRHALRSAPPGSGTGGSASGTAVLEVEIKSASRRTVYRRSPPEACACSSCKIKNVTGSVAIQGERVVERCLVIGIARLGLPSYILRHEHGRKYSPISGWYAVKEGESGAHRGKVKISVLPPNWPACVRTLDKQGNNSNSRPGSSEGDQSGPHRHCSLSLSKAKPTRGKLGRASAAGCSNVGIDGSLSDSSGRSEDTDKAVLATLRQAGGARQGWEEESGLLLVSVSHPAIRSPVKDKTPSDDPASLLGATVSLQRGHDNNTPAPANPSDGHASGSSAHESSRAGESTHTAVLGVDKRELRGHPVLHVRVSVAPPYSHATYHDIVDLSPCLSSVGLEIQEKINLTKEQGGSRVHSSVYRHASSTSGASALFGGDRRSERWKEGRAGGAREATASCTVNVTTTYVPHTSGVLEVNPSELRLTPPSTEDINRWCAYTDLREATEPRVNVARAPQASQASQGLSIGCTTESTRCVFLRVTVKPSGPWGFTRTFQANWPRPMKWARDCSNAGVTRIPVWAPLALEIDTFIHAEKRSSTSSTGGGGEFEALTLEVCLFDNLPSSPSCLLGRGTLPLTPFITAGCPQAHHGHGQRTANPSPASKRNFSSLQADKEVALIEPMSGVKIASVALGVTFLHGGGATSGAASHPRVLADAHVGTPTTDASTAATVAWSLKAMFYHLDHRHTGAAPLDELLDSGAAANWPWGKSRVSYAGGIMGPTEGQVNKRGVVFGRWKAVGARGRRRFSGRSIAGPEGDDGKRWVRRLLEPLISKDDEIVSWEVWAAFCEVLCQAGDASLITPASVWKRAAELLSAALCSSTPCSNEHKSMCEHHNADNPSRTGRDTTSHGFGHGTPHNGGDASQGRTVCGYNIDKQNDGGFDELENGYDVVTFVTDERSLEKPVHDHGASVGESFFRATSPSTRPTATRRRLHRTLATSQRAWSSQHQPHPHPQEGPTNGVKTFLPQTKSSVERGSTNRVKVFSSQKTSTSIVERDSTNRVESFSPQKTSTAVPPLREPDCALRPGVNESNLRPATAPPPPRCRTNANPPSSTTPFRPASADHRLPTTNHEVVRGMELDPSSSRRELNPAQVGAWGVASEGNVAREERENAAREGETRRLELDNSRKEASSAKRKASQYKACMLEAQQSSLDEERRRVLLLEERALCMERQLLQRDRVRIHEAARARARFLELEMNRTRRSDRLLLKRTTEDAEAAAATTLQLTAKGFVQRVRYKAFVVSIVALQRMVRLKREARSRRRHRAWRLSATLLLQSLWRGRLARKLLAARVVVTTKAQALVRGALLRARIRGALQAHLRRRREAAAAMQKNRRQAVARRAFLALRVASVKVQMCYRRRRATKIIQRAARLYLFNLGREKAANLLQTSYRLSARTKKARRARQIILAAAGALQRVARGWEARRAVREVLEARRRNDAASTVQRYLGRYLAAQKIRRRRIATAISICKAVGIFSARLSRFRLRRATAAASAIQSVYRGHRFRIETGARLAAQHQAAIKVQRSFRSRHQRERLAFIERRTRRRNNAIMTNKQAFPKTKSTRQTPRLTPSSLGVVTPAVRPEDPGHASASPTSEEESSEKQVARAPITQAGPSSSSPPVTTGEDKDETARRRCREREALQSAVQAVAMGMARHGAITPDDARGLNHTLSLGEDDPALEVALRLKLSGLQAATVRS